MKLLFKLSFSLYLTVLTFDSHAHHSFYATFTDQEITIEGVVERMSFTNPHVMIFFSVMDQNREIEQWQSEGEAATVMRQRGWDKETLKAGDLIRITGNSSRNGSPMVSTGTINFIDPDSGAIVGTPGGDANQELDVVLLSPLVRADGLPNLSGAWTMREGQRVGPPPEIRGMGPTGMGGRRTIPLNEIGAALQAKFDPANDPQVQCEPPGLVRQAATTPHPLKIEQYPDHVVIAYEEYAGVRKIYFDERDLIGGEHSHLGQSIARYDEQKLVIESTHLKANLTTPGGYALSDQTTTVETYYRKQDADGRSVLAMEMVITDPGHLSRPHIANWEKFYHGDYEFIEVDCQKPL